MQFKKLEWLDNISDGVLVASHCIIKVYSSVKIEFHINHEKAENTYSLYSFGIGSIRRLEPIIFQTVEEAKIAAYNIYNKELRYMKKQIDSFLVEI